MGATPPWLRHGRMMVDVASHKSAVWVPVLACRHPGLELEAAGSGGSSLSTIDVLQATSIRLAWQAHFGVNVTLALGFLKGKLPHYIKLNSSPQHSPYMHHTEETTQYLTGTSMRAQA